STSKLLQERNSILGDLLEASLIELSKHDFNIDEAGRTALRRIQHVRDCLADSNVLIDESAYLSKPLENSRKEPWTAVTATEPQTEVATFIGEPSVPKILPPPAIQPLHSMKDSLMSSLPSLPPSPLPPFTPPIKPTAEDSFDFSPAPPPPPPAPASVTQSMPNIASSSAVPTAMTVAPAKQSSFPTASLTT